MGVRGLQTFIKANTSLSSSLELSDTSLVIDGKNLLFYLFGLLMEDQKHAKDDHYGGDLVEFGNLIQLFFANLDKCNIVPFLVFDGASKGKRFNVRAACRQESGESKRDELVKFVATIREGGGYMTSNKYRTIVFPSMIRHVFKTIARDMGIKSVQTAYEADSNAAQLANQLKCPILTNDSDFLMYDIPNGYIMNDRFEFRRVKQNTTGYYIQCSIVKQDNLLSFFPTMQMATLPLLGILLSYDYVEAFEFDKLCDRVAKSQYRGKLVATSFAHRRITKLLAWLSGKSPELAIDLLVTASYQQREQIRHVLEDGLRNYKAANCDDCVSELNRVYSQDCGKAQKEAGSFLMKLMEHGGSNSFMLNIIFWNTFYNHVVVDDHSMQSCNIVKDRPIGVCLSLLRAQAYNEDETIVVWDRVGGAYGKRTSIGPCRHLDKFGSLDQLNIDSLMNMAVDRKKLLLLDTFYASTELLSQLTGPFSEILSPDRAKEAGLIMILLRYSALEQKRIKSMPEFFEGLYLTLIYYAVRSKDEKMIHTMDKNSLETLMASYEMLNNEYSLDHGENESLFRRIVHFISMLQACIYSYGSMNSLLSDPLEIRLRLEGYLNCVLIFKMTKCLSLGKISMDSFLGAPECQCLLANGNLLRTLTGFDG